MGPTKPGAAHSAGSISPLKIDPTLGNPNRVVQAIREHWEEQTNIRFASRAGQGHFVLFHQGRSAAQFVPSRAACNR
jgi:hypothetical protein